MDYFGDESGHLKSVLQGNEQVSVMAIVAGDKIACAKCPKKTVRNVTDIDEAKWNDLMDKQKRRLFECFADNDYLTFGYAKFTREQLKSVDNDYLLFQDVEIPPAWDLALAGYAYGEILYEMGAREDDRPLFRFDRISSQKQSEHVLDHIKHFVPGVQVMYGGSKQIKGIQAADCLAGAVAEDHKKGTAWLDMLNDDNIVECSYLSLAQLESALHECDTGP